MQVWPCGHATDAEETIAFTELENINCMVEKFPLERAQDAFGNFPLPYESSGLTLLCRCNDEGYCPIQNSDYDGLACAHSQICGFRKGQTVFCFPSTLLGVMVHI